MTIPLARTVRERKQAISRQLPQRRDDSGLTTLEWLLIVAAVAGLAALAVVLVQNVVGDTSEQIAGSSARETAAKIAATTIMEDANRDASAQPAGAKTWSDWMNHYTSKCRRLAITYGDAGIDVESTFVAHASGTATEAIETLDLEVDEARIHTGNVDGDYVTGAGADDADIAKSATPDANRALAECRVS